MKWKVILFLQTLITGSLFCQSDEAFPFAINRGFNAPEIVVLSQLNDGSISESVLIAQGLSKPVRKTHFGYTHNHFLGDDSATDSLIVSRSKAIGPAFIRFPGGNGANRYFWDGNPPALIRQDDVVTASDLIDPGGASMGTEELFLLCDSTGGEPVFVVNFSFSRYGWGQNRVEQAASYAANWVRYVNQTLGRYVQYWEIGNENYGDWQAGSMVEGELLTGEMYGQIFRVFADSMKAVDPTIQLGAVIYPIDEQYDDWTAQVLPEVENDADFLIVHDYFEWAPNENNITYNEMMGSIIEVSENAESVATMVDLYTEKPEGYFPVAFTEFNSNTGHREVAMANALFISRVLLEQIMEGFEMSMIWNIQGNVSEDGGSHGLLNQNSPNLPDGAPRPAYYTYWLLQKYLGQSIDRLETNVSQVSAYETTHSNGAKGGILVNSGPSSRTLSWPSPSSSFPFIHWHILSAEGEADKSITVNGIGSPYAEGGPLNPQSIVGFGALTPDTVTFTLPPYSILAFSRASAESIMTIESCEPIVIEDEVFSTSTVFANFQIDETTGLAEPVQYNLLIAEPENCNTEGCMNPNFIEFSPFAVADNGSCQTLVVSGCTYIQSSNFDPLANRDDGSCEFSSSEGCPGDVNGNGFVGTDDLLLFLSSFGVICP